MAYRKLNRLQEQLENMSCQEEIDDLLLTYTLQVFKVTSNFEDMCGVSFYVADGTANQLTAELNRDNKVDGFQFAEWRTTRMK